jgi:plastocyanin
MQRVSWLGLLVLLVGSCSTDEPEEVMVQVVANEASQGAYSPGILRVQPGDVVIWIQQDGALHTVTAEDASFRSKLLQRGQRFQVRFNRRGVYPYRCTLHPRMAGSVVVE